MNDEHIITLVKTIDGTDLNAIHIFAADAIVGHNISHLLAPEDTTISVSAVEVTI
jgi:hypothetical protein